MEEKKILVRSYAILGRVDADGSETQIHYIRTEFHLMDLKSDQIDLCCFPSLLYCTLPGSMVVSGSCLYILGGLSPSIEDLVCVQDLFSDPRRPEDLYLGGACLDLDSSHLVSGWSPVRVPNLDRIVPHCAELNGKIYSFGFYRPCPEVFDPAVGEWMFFSAAPLPSHLDHAHVYYRVLPDSENNRILLQLSGGGLDEPSLYAFYPDGNNGSSSPWTCLAPSFRQWYHIATVADDVLYIHNRKKYRSSILGAYDLASGIWLDVEWTSPFEDHVHKKVAHREFDAVFPLGPQTLCLAHRDTADVLSRDASRGNMLVFLLKVQVDRIGSTIRLIPISSHIFEVPNAHEVLEFIPV